MTVALQAQCDPVDPACDGRKNIVWSQSPVAGTEATSGSTVSIVVNP